MTGFILLHIALLIYSTSGLFSKNASLHPFGSLPFILFYAGMIMVLGIYAILWQQIIKKFQLSVAYANKAMTLLWSMVWNFLIFSQGITVKKVIGVLIVMAGVVVMNMGEGKDV